MKQIVASALTILCAVSTDAQSIPDRPTLLHPGTINVSYDRFRDATIAQLKPLQLSMVDMRLAIAITGTGANLATSPTRLITGFLMHTSSSWRYLRCHDVAFIADDARILGLPTRHRGDVGGGGFVIEQIQFDLTQDQLIQLATAKSVEVKICNTEFRLQEREIMAVRDLASRLKEP